MNQDNEKPEVKRRIKIRMLAALDRAHKTEHKLVTRAVLWGHLSYYSLVTFEAHGAYSYAAGVVGILLVVEAVLGGGDVE